MRQLYCTLLVFTVIICTISIISCRHKKNGHAVAQEKIVSKAEDMDNQTANSIEDALQFGMQNKGKIDDKIHLQFINAVNTFYDGIHYKNIWSHKEKWEPLADSLYQFINNAAIFGLFANDYHLQYFQSLKHELDTDSLKRTDAILWTKADLLLTDAFMHLVKDLKEGRLNRDSISLNKKNAADSLLGGSLTALFSGEQLWPLLYNLQPKNSGYEQLINCLPKFLDSMDKKVYTYINYPFKINSEKDSLLFVKNLQNRLSESKCIEVSETLPDTLQLKMAIKKYQKLRAIRQDGKISGSLVKLMNTNDAERFKRIAITLDRYKQLPDTMPEKYIWVNLPAYYLQLWDHDTLVMDSKVIVGKPATRTPLLNSFISDMVTYPTWTVPASIITKQYLPKLKINPGYLKKLGLHLENNKGETIDGNTINWSKYKKAIPYKVMQGSGDDNALGIFKFNFNNEYAVYLHDTNQRYLFKNALRDLSHGCVRVQQWEKLADFIAANDSINLKPGDQLRYNADSIKTWIDNKINKRIAVKNKVFLFIRYFTCEAKDGKIKFYDDIYGEDKAIREKYFADKN